MLIWYCLERGSREFDFNFSFVNKIYRHNLKVWSLFLYLLLHALAPLLKLSSVGASQKVQYQTRIWTRPNVVAVVTDMKKFEVLISTKRGDNELFLPEISNLKYKPYGDETTKNNQIISLRHVVGHFHLSSNENVGLKKIVSNNIFLRSHHAF